jgi:hypothetical protein
MQGEIVASGVHDELMKTSTGLCADLQLAAKHQ